MLNKMRTVALAAGLALGTLALPAAAATITGTFSMGGGFTPIGGSLGTATGIDFSGTLIAKGPITGDFSGLIAVNDTGTINDFSFAPFSPVDDLYTINGFTFDLDTISVVNQSNSFLLLAGTGVISGNGFDATEATWNFSANSFNQLTFSWSASTGASGLPGGGGADVPEPATLALLGAGLAVLGATRRRR